MLAFVLDSISCIHFHTFLARSSRFLTCDKVVSSVTTCSYPAMVPPLLSRSLVLRISCLVKYSPLTYVDGNTPQEAGKHLYTTVLINSSVLSCLQIFQTTSIL
jgi:hypothetical protein